MSPARLTEYLALMGWSNRQLAAALGCDEGLIRKWIAGKLTTPPSVARWLEYRAKHATPAPSDWRA